MVNPSWGGKKYLQSLTIPLFENPVTGVCRKSVLQVWLNCAFDSEIAKTKSKQINL